MGRLPRPRQSKGKWREPRHKDEEEPFILLTIKVGCCILCISWAATHAILLFSNPTSQFSPVRSSSHFEPHRHDSRSYSGAKFASDKGSRAADEVDTFPSFQLDPQLLNFDAFGIHDKIIAGQYNNQQLEFKHFHDEVSRLKKQFASHYGGENAARHLIHSGVTTFLPSAHTNHPNNFDSYDMQSIPAGLKYTAYRIISARLQNRQFKMAFGGYSVTVGRGNYFNQSYPFVMEKLLTKPMELLGIELNVRNAAIGGVPSFPYGW